MPLHLIKLCVGVSEVDELREWQDRRLAEGGDVFHVTRMFPRRGDELLDGGSLYWVIKGFIQVRQRIAGLVPITDAEGISRCKIVFEPELVATRFQPRRAFQGWRYLLDEDAPADLPQGDDTGRLPAEMRAKLAELGLL
jgi:hypothetical protein